jgi:hypothetical protein
MVYSREAVPLLDGMQILRMFMMKVEKERDREFCHTLAQSQKLTKIGRYHLTMIFGGGELLMEAMDLITDEPEFDAAWLDFCRLFNASNDE